MPRTIKKESILDLVAHAIPDSDLTKPLILEKLVEMIPGDNDAELLEDLDDPKAKKIIKMYRAYSGNDGPFRMLNLLLWWRNDSRKIILDLEQRMGEIKQLLNQFGDVNPDKDVVVPGHVIIDIRFNTISPLIDTEENEP